MKAIKKKENSKGEDKDQSEGNLWNERESKK